MDIFVLFYYRMIKLHQLYFLDFVYYSFRHLSPFSFGFRVVVFLISFFITTETVSMLRFCVSIYLIMLLEKK